LVCPRRRAPIRERWSRNCCRSRARRTFWAILVAAGEQSQNEVVADPSFAGLHAQLQLFSHTGAACDGEVEVRVTLDGFGPVAAVEHNLFEIEACFMDAPTSSAVLVNAAVMGQQLWLPCPNGALHGNRDRVRLG